MENNGKKFIVGLGEALWDKTLKTEVKKEAETNASKEGMTLMEYIESKKLFEDEKNYDKKPGGAPSNFAYHVAQWLDMDKNKVLVVSSLGRDDDGNELNNILKEKGLNEVPQIEGYKTGEVWVKLDDDGKPMYDIREGAYDHIPFDKPLENGMTLQEIAEDCCAVCFGSLAQRKRDSRDTIRKFLQATADGCLKIFDINLRQNHYSKEIIKESLGLCNILKINDEELITLGQMFDFSDKKEPKDKCKAILNKFENLKMIILTCGEKCSYVFTSDLPDQPSYQDTPLVKVGSTIGDAYLDRPKIVKKLDTVGAGDSFTGSFIAAILSGKKVVEAHKRAVQVSAFVCTQEGAMPEIPGVIMRKYE